MDLDQPTVGPSAQTLKWDVGAGELPMWVADMDFEPPEPVRKAVLAAAQEARFGYATADVTSFAEALSQWWSRRYGLELDPAWVLFTPGVNAGIGSVLRTLTAPGDAVCLLSPNYHHFFHTIKSNGREVVTSQMVYDGFEFRIDWADLEEKLAKPHVNVLILCNPHNPTGQLWDAATLARIGSLAATTQVQVIADEIHGDLTDPGFQYTPFLWACAEGAAAITTVAPSKPFNLAGLQCAALVVPQAAKRARIAKGLRRDELSRPNVFAQVAAVAAYREAGGWLDQVRTYIAANRAWVTAELHRRTPAVRVLEAHATYLMWLDLRAIVQDSVQFVRAARQQTGLIVEAGPDFGPGGEGFIRLNLAASRCRVEDGVNRLVEALELAAGR
jgi:cystathionine beta-lyase